MAGNTSNTGSWVPQVNTVGLRNVGSYQVSGHPYMTGATIYSQNQIDTSTPAQAAGTKTQHEIVFPYVTRSFTVFNKSTSASKSLRVRFESTSSTTNDDHYVTVAAGGSFTFEVKCATIYITGKNNLQSFTYEVYGSLTNIPTSRMYDLTGSGISD